MISNSVLRQQKNRHTSYDEVVEMIKTVPAECLSNISNYIGYVLYCYNGKDEKIRKLKNAIQEGEESGICDNFDPDSFLKTLKSERKIESKFWQHKFTIHVKQENISLV